MVEVLECRLSLVVESRTDDPMKIKAVPGNYLCAVRLLVILAGLAALQVFGFSQNAINNDRQQTANPT